MTREFLDSPILGQVALAILFACSLAGASILFWMLGFMRKVEKASQIVQAVLLSMKKPAKERN